MMPRISVVVVTYRSRDFIERCLRPFEGRPDIELILIENASGDDVVDFVRSRFPRVRILDNEENLGFARGNNKAFEFCHGQYVLLLNPDAFVEDAGVVDRLADYLDAHPDVGAVGPKLTHADGNHQVGDAGWRIGLGSILVHALLLQRLFYRLPSLYLTNPRLLDQLEVSVDWVCGACMMVRRNVILDVGGLDDKVFMYGEDIEWGTRIRKAGWCVKYLPQYSVLHLQGASQKGSEQIFVSTKWMDDAAARYAIIGKPIGYSVLKTGLFLGYSFRSVAWRLLFVMRQSPERRKKAKVMWRYALHALNLPSYAVQRRNAS